MKKLIVTTVILFVTTSSMASANADRSFFNCMSDRLAAYNSSVYYGITKDEIVDILDDSQHAFYSDAVRTAKSCLENPNP